MTFQLSDTMWSDNTQKSALQRHCDYLFIFTYAVDPTLVLQPDSLLNQSTTAPQLRAFMAVVASRGGDTLASWVQRISCTREKCPKSSENTKKNFAGISALIHPPFRVFTPAGSLTS